MAAPTPAPDGVRHHVLEDLFGLLAGVALTSLGLYLLRTAGMVTGGTAGVALLIGYAAPVPFGLVFALVNLPFMLLAALRRGAVFAVKSVVSIVSVSFLTQLDTALIPIQASQPWYFALLGNLVAGVGLLILFRHGSSLGGFNVIALLVQDRWGIRAGLVLMALDAVVILCAFFVVAPEIVLLSAAGAIVLNAVLAVNHRPDRYLGR
jgi:uncharacterized membrane-anchored protein YitT (DUF2179 family)